MRRPGAVAVLSGLLLVCVCAFGEVTAKLDQRTLARDMRAFFDVSTPAPTRNESFEAVAPVGQNLIHVITRLDGPTNLKDAKTIAAGPAGSSSARIAGLLKAGLGLTGDVLEEADASAAGLTGKIRDGGADSAPDWRPRSSP